MALDVEGIVDGGVCGKKPRCPRASPCGDAQFLQGKTIQAEFGYALNALLDAGRDVVVAADRPPNDLEALDERVRSRLGAGLCVEIGPLDEPLRLKILEARVAA